MDAAASVRWVVEGDGLRLTLPNDREAFGAARQAVMDFLAAHSTGEQTLFAVELVLEESLMNVIWHAFDDDAKHDIDLRVQIVPEAIEMHFEDDGMAFDPLQAAEPTLPESIDEAVPGGLGLMLVRKFSRSIAYERRGERNHLTISVART